MNTENTEMRHPTLPGYGRLFLFFVVSHAATLLLIRFFGYELSRFWSLAAVSAAASTGLLIFSLGYLKGALGKIAVYIIFSAFFLKLAVGVWHYITFLDPEYFTSDKQFSYFLDYEWMHQKMVFAANYWRESGFSQLPASFYLGNKNPFLLAYNGVLYFLGGNNHLNIAPWNALHSIYVAVLTGVLALSIGATKRQAVFALTLAAFQPFGFISSIMWRDSVGQTWLVLGVFLLISTAEKKYWWIVALPLACFLTWSVRQPYLLIILALAAYLVYASQQVKAKGWFILLVAGILAFSFNFIPDLMSLALGRFQGTDQMVFSPFTFPLRMVRALAGPFPWFQVFLGVDGVEYMPLDFIQAVYNLALIILVLPAAYGTWKKSGSIDPGLMVFAMVFITAAQALGVHMPYVSVGVVLLIPLAALHPPEKWKSVFLKCFVGFLTANLLYWVLGLSGSGILQVITGY